MSDKSTEQPEVFGKAMIYIMFFLLLGLLLNWAFNDLLDKKHNPNQQLQTQNNSDGSKSVVLLRNAYGHYVSTGTINGQTVIFFLDTGATEVSIPINIANKLSLKKGLAFPVNTANGSVTVYKTKIDSITLGDIQFYDIPAHINPHMKGMDILLGMSFLKHLEFTQRGEQLTIRQY